MKIRKKDATELSILFVDDEEKAGKYFNKFFGIDFNICTATSYHEALEILSKKSNEIAIVVSDQRMPKNTGVQLLNQVKEKYPNIIRILTTAYSDLQDNISAINESNVFGYLTKPWNPDEVRIILYKAFSEFKTRQALLSLSGSIAHEIRNPLLAINLSLNQIEDYINYKQSDGSVKIKEQDVIAAEKIIKTAYSSIRRANDIIDVTLNKLKNKDLDPHNFNYVRISDILQSVIEEYGYRNEDEKKKIFINNTNDDFVVKADETSLIYVFFNLINNAFYYLSEYPHSTIEIKTKKGDKLNEVWVTDTGPGIQTDKIESIFNNFYSSGKNEGTGLGLPFCKRMMVAFGGNIKCESELKKYTKFTLSFPSLSDEQIKVEKLDKICTEEADTVKIISGKRILLADDQEVNLMLVQKFLERFGLIVQTAKDGDDLLKKYIKNIENGKNYDLILTDIIMPVMNGGEAAKGIRRYNKENNINQNLPIVAITGNGTKNEIRNILSEYEMNDYFIKGSELRNIIQIITNLLQEPLSKLLA